MTETLKLNLLTKKSGEMTKTLRLNLKCDGLYARVHFRKDITNTELFFLSFHYDTKINNERIYGTIPTDKKLFIKKNSFSLDKLPSKADTKNLIIDVRNYYIKTVLPNLQNQAKEKKTEEKTTKYILNMFLDFKQNNISKSTLNNYKFLFNDFVKSSYCPKYYQELKPKNIVDYLENKKDKEQTFNKKLNAFRTLDIWQASFFNNNSVINGIKIYKKEVKADAHRKAPIVNNEKDFLEAIKLYVNSTDYTEAKQVLCFAFFLPLRIDELLKIKVKNIDFNNVCLNLDKTKTCQQGLIYPISKTLLNIFKKLITKNNLTSEDFIFAIARKYKIPYQKLLTSIKLDFDLHGIRSVINSYVTTLEAQKRLNISEADTRIYGDILLTHETKSTIQKIYNRNQNTERYQGLNEILHTFLYSVLKNEIEFFTK